MDYPYFWAPLIGKTLSKKKRIHLYPPSQNMRWNHESPDYKGGYWTDGVTYTEEELTAADGLGDLGEDNRYTNTTANTVNFRKAKNPLWKREPEAAIYFWGWRDQWWTDPGTTELQVVGAMGMHEDEPKKGDARRGHSVCTGFENLSQDLNPEYGLKFSLSSANDNVSMYVKTGVRGKERKSFAMKFEDQGRMSNICSDRNSCEGRARSPWDKCRWDGKKEQSAKFGRKMTAARGRI
ncbi:hypothetical protein B0H14DRAFT_2567609 [Mycena olivaceomarginata]|nr:hypothetical protein B0H14DRAFT_2567609 [Mycena olivaceomarginata]